MPEKISVAVLGLGGMGGTHAAAYKKSQYVDKIYGYEPDAAYRAKRAGEIGVIPADLDEILANPEIRLCSIAAVNEVHAELAEKSMKAGKAVLCEKPMGSTLAEAENLIRLYRSLPNAFLQIGFELHYSKLYMLAKQWIDEGKIGQPVDIQTRYYCCEFHGKNNWRSNSTGSFLIGEKLSHYLDLQRWFMGSEPETVYSVSAPKVVPYFHHRDNHNITTKFRNGGVGVLTFLMNAPATAPDDPLQDLLDLQADDGHFLQYFIVGTKGAIETDVFRRRIRRWEFSDSPKSLVSKIVETVSYTSKEDHIWIHNTTDESIRVAELVAKGLPPEVSPEDAYQSMRLCFAAEQSEDEARIVSLS